jgi:hypothetical protein
MSDQPAFRYYAHLRDSDGEPGGILRRDPNGNQVDEVFTRDGTWRPGWWLRDYERGDDNRPFVELTPEKVEDVIQRWTKKWAEEDSGNASP